jgi:hypothetical protein
MRVLTRDEILGNKRPPKMEPVRIPHWGDGGVYVKELSAGDVDAFEAAMQEEAKKSKDGEYRPNVRGRVLALCLCDGEGKPIFKPEDADALGEFPKWQIDALIDAAFRLNRLSEAYEKGLEKKYARRGDGASPADSPGSGESETREISLTKSPKKSSNSGGRTGQ